MGPYMISVKHNCGHTAERALQKYNPFKKRYENVQDIRDMSPPQVLLAQFEKSVKSLTPKAIAYWEQKPCLECWKAEA